MHICLHCVLNYIRFDLWLYMLMNFFSILSPLKNLLLHKSICALWLSLECSLECTSICSIFCFARRLYDIALGIRVLCPLCVFYCFPIINRTYIILSDVDKFAEVL